MKNSAVQELEKYLKGFISLLQITNKSKHTIISYKNTLKSFISYIKYEFVDFDIKNIKKTTILAYFEYKNNNLQKQGEISPHTKKLLFVHLKTFFKYIEDENEDKLYDFRKTFDFKINVPKRIPKGLEPYEKDKLLKYLDNLLINSNSSITDYRNSIIIKIFLYCGLREQEMINLKIVDLKEEDEETYVIYIIGKGNKERELFLKKSLIDLELEELKENNFIYICETKTKEIMDSSQIYRMVTSIYKKLSIKGNVHDLRHTFAKSLSYRNVDITVIKELLGHSSIQTTAIYTNPSRARIKSAAGIF